MNISLPIEFKCINIILSKFNNMLLFLTELFILISYHNILICFNKYFCYFGAWVICGTWFTGSREICELWKDVNLKSKFTEKTCDKYKRKYKLDSRAFFFN